jgi:hypothetical protein
MNIKDYEIKYKNYKTDLLKSVLEDTLKTIRMLENIYQSMGDFYSEVSEDFRNKTYNERQNLCRKSSAIYSLLRERGENV